MVLELTESNFDEHVNNSNLPVIVDFWAEWCGPCRTIGPIIHEIGSTYAGKVVVGKVDVDNNPGIAGKFGIRSIPTILFIKNGQVVDKQVGAVPKPVIVKKVESML